MGVVKANVAVIENYLAQMEKEKGLYDLTQLCDKSTLSGIDIINSTISNENKLREAIRELEELHIKSLQGTLDELVILDRKMFNFTNNSPSFTTEEKPVPGPLPRANNDVQDLFITLERRPCGPEETKEVFLSIERQPISGTPGPVSSVSASSEFQPKPGTPGPDVVYSSSSHKIKPCL